MQNLFYPQSIAVIGASDNPQKVGFQIVKNILESNYQGKLYLINQNQDTILDRQSLTSIDQVEDTLDLIIIVIPARIIPSEMQKIIRQKSKFNPQNTSNLVIISAGFKETGVNGVILEKEITNLCQQNQIRLVGPNCLGIINNDMSSDLRFNGSFAFTPKISGWLSLISQSGAIISGLLDKAEARGFGFNKIVSVGNKADLDEADFLEYFENDASTKLIAIYMEGFSNGQKFVSIAKIVTKPIIILKAGKTESAKSAVSSHTGSIAGNHKIATAYLKKANCVMVDNLEEFFDTIQIFSRYGI